MGLKPRTLLIAVALFSTHAPGIQTTHAKPPTSKVSAKNSSAAKKAYLEAEKLFRAGEDKLALPLFRKAYELSNRRPSTILALAQCERENKMYTEAIAHFYEYLASQPDPKQVTRVKETLKILDQLQKQARTEENQRQAEAKAEEERRRQDTENLARELAKKLALPAPSAERSVTVAPETSVWSNTWLWVALGVIAAGAGTAAVFVAMPKEDIYGGTTSTILRP